MVSHRFEVVAEELDDVQPWATVTIVRVLGEEHLEGATIDVVDQLDGTYLALVPDELGVADAEALGVDAVRFVHGTLPHHTLVELSRVEATQMTLVLLRKPEDV